MSSFLIGYDLDKPGQNYADLEKAILEIDNNCWHCLDSTWIVNSELSAKQIRDNLKPHLDSNDKLLVARFTGEGAWTGFPSNCSQWLRDNL